MITVSTSLPDHIQQSFEQKLLCTPIFTNISMSGNKRLRYRRNKYYMKSSAFYRLSHRIGEMGSKVYTKERAILRMRRYYPFDSDIERLYDQKIILDKESNKKVRKRRLKYLMKNHSFVELITYKERIKHGKR